MPYYCWSMFILLFSWVHTDVDFIQSLYHRRGDNRLLREWPHWRSSFVQNQNLKLRKYSLASFEVCKQYLDSSCFAPFFLLCNRNLCLVITIIIDDQCLIYCFFLDPHWCCFIFSSRLVPSQYLTLVVSGSNNLPLSSIQRSHAQ